MKTKTDTRRTQAHGLPRDDSAYEVLEFVINDEEEALSSEHTVLSHQRDMPAVLARADVHVLTIVWRGDFIHPDRPVFAHRAAV